MSPHAPATAQDVVRRILGSAWWAGFTFNGITAYGDGYDNRIGGIELSDGEREQRGEEVFAHRSRHRAPISDSVKYRVLTDAPGPLRMLRGARTPAGPGRGTHHPQKPGRLRRHQQPAGALLPLQRRQARRLFAYARGRTDFRGVQASYGHHEAGCVFCALEGSGRALLENELALCIADAYPVSEGHSLVILRRQGADGLELHQPEWNAVVELLELWRGQLSAQDATIGGWAGLLNARGGLNSGEAAGETVFHVHLHLIPRRTGADKSPRGGVRGVINGKQHY